MEKNEIKEVNEWTRKEFEALPLRKWGEDIGVFDSLIILPQRRIHDSGYACMDFVAVSDEEPKCLLSGCSDVIHINGIGGFGFNWTGKYGTVPNQINPIAWSIDCLKTSKLLRLFTEKKLRAGEALSSFEIYSVNNKEL